MKFPKISQSELNTIVLFGIGIAFLLALFAYFHKKKNTEGFGGSSKWKLTTDDGDISLQYKRRNKFKVAGDGTIKNTVIDTIKQKLADLERRLNVVPKTPAGSMESASSPAPVGSIKSAPSPAPAGSMKSAPSPAPASPAPVKAPPKCADGWKEVVGKCWKFLEFNGTYEQGLKTCEAAGGKPWSLDSIDQIKEVGAKSGIPDCMYAGSNITLSDGRQTCPKCPCKRPFLNLRRQPWSAGRNQWKWGDGTYLTTNLYNQLEYGPNAKGERTKRMSNDPPRAASKDTNNESGEKAGLCIELIRNPGGVVTWNDINCNATGLGGALCSKNKE